MAVRGGDGVGVGACWVLSSKSVATIGGDTALRTFICASLAMTTRRGLIVLVVSSPTFHLSRFVRSRFVT